MNPCSHLERTALRAFLLAPGWKGNMPLTTACGQLKPNILSQCECELDCRFKANKMPQEQIAIVFSIGCTGDGEIKV